MLSGENNNAKSQLYDLRQLSLALGKSDDAKRMQSLPGISLEKLPLPSLQKVADLIVGNEIILTHYESQAGDPFLFFRVDEDDYLIRWFIFRATSQQFIQLIDNKITVQYLLTHLADGFLYGMDTDRNMKQKHLRMILPEQIPTPYLSQKLFLSAKSQVTERVDLMKWSERCESGLFQIGFHHHSKVGYGTIYLSLLAPTLAFFQEIADGLSYSYYRKVADAIRFSTSQEKLSRPEAKEVILSAARFEVVGTLAGNFSLILRPLNQQLPLPGHESEPDRFSKYLLDFFEASYDFDRLKEFVTKVDGKIISNYQHLLKMIRSTKLTFRLSWANAFSQHNESIAITPKDAFAILDNITQLEYLTDTDFRLTGRFVSLSIKTHMYVFEPEDSKEAGSKGFIASALHAGVPYISFSRRYDVVIERKEIKQAGQIKPKIIDLLIAFAPAESE
jgi:hypothetical protein